MDFWASLEHKIYYKFEGKSTAYISRDLRECAEMVSALDEKDAVLERSYFRMPQAAEERARRGKTGRA